jgi:hypothetical protein
MAVGLVIQHVVSILASNLLSTDEATVFQILDYSLYDTIRDTNFDGDLRSTGSGAECSTASTWACLVKTSSESAILWIFCLTWPLGRGFPVANMSSFSLSLYHLHQWTAARPNQIFRQPRRFD